MTGLMIDNYDSFTDNLARYFTELGESIVTYQHDAITLDDISQLNPDYIILSPGPKHPVDAGICLSIINRFKESIPILGICLGHQCIAHAFGAEVRPLDEIYHGKTSLTEHQYDLIFTKIPRNFTVTRYHSLAIVTSTLTTEIEIIARTGDVIMGIKHKHFPIYGLQYHPEAHLTEHGHQVLKNFLTLCANPAEQKTFPALGKMSVA